MSTVTVIASMFFMFTPPNRSYHSDGVCDGYVVSEAPAIGGCTQWDNEDDEKTYQRKVKFYNYFFGGDKNE